jgi:outer membrane protein assembly factor BamB
MRRRLVSRLCAALLLPALAAGAEPSWPQFRGPSASGLGTGTPPLTWDGESGKKLLWKTPIPGLGHSSPVIWGDRIFLTSAVPAAGQPALKLGLYGDIQPVEGEGTQRFQVYCLDRKSGKILWQRTATAAVPKVKRHPKSTHANPTPATDGRHVVAFFGSEGLLTYDLDGKLLWRKDLGVLDAGFFQAPDAQWGFASSPIIHEGMVIVQADVQKNSFLAAFDVKTGQELWRAPRQDVPTFGTPTAAPYTGSGSRGQQIVVNGWKHIGGYEVRTGRELWKLRGGGDIPVPTPVFLDGLIVITNAHGRQRPIYALRTGARGDITESREGIAWSQERAGNYMQTPLLHDGLGYFCYDNGVLSVFRLADGERLYQQRLGSGSAGFSSSPVAAAGRIYITNEDGRTYVLAMGPAYQALAENELGETVMATPAIAAGVLYIRGRSHLFAIGEKP